VSPTSFRQVPGSDVVKSCCAALYQDDYLRVLLGDSFHPGGVVLTKHLGSVLELGPSDHVLDVASGSGTSAFALADTFGCRVTGVDYGEGSVARANTAAHDLCDFHVGDAERLPFDDEAFDAVISECAFCTFPAKDVAAREMFRVLKPGGRLGLTDLTIGGPVPAGLDNLLSVVACIGDARSAAEYEAILIAGGFADLIKQDQSQHLLAMVTDMRKKIDLARLASAIKKLDLGGLDLEAARATAQLAIATIESGMAGYVLLAGRRPD